MSNSRRAAETATLPLFLFLCAAGASAQPIATSDASVEWVAADSPLIVRAVIEDVAVHALKDGLHVDSGIHRFQTVTVRVLETLRGEPVDRLQFVQDGDFHGVRLAELEADKQEVLLFLEPWARHPNFYRSQGGYAYARFPFAVHRVIVLAPEKVYWTHSDLPVRSSNLTGLSTPKQVTDAIRSYLDKRRGQLPPQDAFIHLPVGLREGHADVVFRFPVDVQRHPPAYTPPPSAAHLDFMAFQNQYGRRPPAESKPPYLRTQSGYVGVYALEQMAADCDAIVRAVIERHCFVFREDDPTGDCYGAELRVVETLKGRTAKRITCYLYDSRDLDKLQREKQELLLFLRDNQDGSAGPPDGALDYRLRAGLWDDSVIVLDEDAAEALFADLTWHRKPEEILARVRAALEAPPLRSEQQGVVFAFHPPRSVAAGSSIAGNQYAVVYLPINDALEKNARRWTAANNQDLRWLAARALIYFKSDKNADLLRGMLDDDAMWSRREMRQLTQLEYPHQPDYLIRWEAWHVLAGWGYDSPEPSFKRER